MKINFNSWNLSLCGGNRFIFELSNRLVDRGYTVSITHVGLPSYHKWFTPIKAEIIDCGYSVFERALAKVKGRITREAMLSRLQEHIPDCDVNVATFCFTAYPTVHSKKGKGYYLVQHYEPDFFVDAATKQFAAYTYRLPLTRLCVSHWLTEKVNGLFIGNGINLAKFKRDETIAKVPKSVMLIIRQGIDWKHPDATHLLADSLERNSYKVYRVQGNLSDKELVETYNKAEYFINLSGKEGFSYNLLEAMRCGCVVLSTYCTEYLKDGVNFVGLPEDELSRSILERLSKLHADPALRSYLIVNGAKTALAYDFEQVVGRFIEKIVLLRGDKA